MIAVDISSSNAMRIKQLFSNRVLLEKELGFFIAKKQIKKIQRNPDLALPHLQKAKHNLAFYKLNKNRNSFNDWLIVVLYYSLYHSALALIIQRGYVSKNHYATILVLMNEYLVSEDEVEFIDELSVTKEDANLYTSLKEERHSASYMTGLKFTNDKIVFYEDKVIEFLNKTEEILKNS